MSARTPEQRARYAEQARARRAAMTDEQRDRAREQRRDRRAARTPEQVDEQRARKAEEDRARYAAISREKRHGRAERHRITVRAARARRAGADVREITRRDLDRLLASPCLACGTPGPSTADHGIPLSRGGRHSIGALLPLCGPCNSRKGTRTFAEWRYADRLTGRQATA